MAHIIDLSDLQFRRVPVDFRSSAGVPQTRWVPVGMPYIPQNVINAVFYLYETMDDALAGNSPQGSGFVVRYEGYGHNSPHELPTRVPGNHFYGLTNWHVAVRGGAPIVRLNTLDGQTDIIEFGPEDWHCLFGKYDVAVVPLNIDPKIHAVSTISTRSFHFAPDPYGPKVGIGDDVFMLGLFVDHAGQATNVPSARFGNVSMLPNPAAKIPQPTGYRGESYIVDMHSRSGFSGSPVFVYRTFGSDFTNDFRGEKVELVNFELSATNSNRAKGRVRVETFFQFLGIHWGQFPELWEMKGGKPLAEARKDLIVDGAYVVGLSGMTCVIPAHHIAEVLEMPALRTLRQPEINAAMAAEATTVRPEEAN
ncbi:hypothetical protein U1839_10370 [Sphingomonas sp. RT2P30]|uniref:hypothetical protein n=1 Tax=Parasphingomonas halimpatiens TaxID=3096162 RepID=UPI002FC71BFB